MIKKILTTLALLAFPSITLAAIIPVTMIRDTTGNFVRPLSSTDGLQWPGLATSTSGCLSVSADGLVSPTGSSCGSGGGAGAYPFTPLTNYAVTNSATTSVLWAQAGINASSTSHFVYASTTVTSANFLCLTGDSCRSTWPTGGGGGSGSVGTSTTDVDGEVTFFTTNSATPALIGGSSNFTWNNTATRLTLPFASTTVLTSSGSAYFATVGGKVGIATANPGYTLDVNGTLHSGSDYTTEANVNINTSGTVLVISPQGDSYSAMRFNKQPSIGGAAGFLGVDFGQAITSTSANGDMVLRSDGGNIVFSNTTSEAMRVSAVGKLGIGTTTPASTLSVQGNGLFSGNLSLANLTATGTVTTQFASTTSITSTGYAAFATAGGNVGIGTTSPGTALTIGKTNGGLFVTNNQAGSGVDPLGAVGSFVVGDSTTLPNAALYVKNAGNRGNIGNVNGSPLFRADFTDATAMIIDKSGYVGIGSTTPSKTFSVHGDTIISGNITSVANITATGTLRLSSLSVGSLYSGTGGIVGVTATTTASCSGTVSCSAFTIFGASPVTITGSGGGSALGVETPVGTVDGANADFTVTNAPVLITVNGQTMSTPDDYSLATLTITFVVPPATGSVIRSYYGGGGSGHDSAGPINAIQAADGAGGFIATGTNSLAANIFIATSTTASRLPYASTTAVSVAALTSGRVTYATTGGLLTDNAALTFDGIKLTATYASTTAISASGEVNIPNGTGPAIGASGDVAYDSTDKQFLIGTTTQNSPIVIPAMQKLWSTTIASTSIEFRSGGRIPLPPQRDGFDIAEFHCFVTGGTSVVFNVSNVAGSSDTETITCATTITSDTDVATNSVWPAGSINSLEIGTVTGAVDYLTLSIWGYITRE